jgi:uncharacterized protein with HEPN domain
MQREPRAFVEDIVVSCDAIASNIEGVDVETYVANRMVRSAVEREFLIIGEAISYLSDLAPDIFTRITEGRTIVDFRDQLVHGYMTVNDRLVWDTPSVRRRSCVRNAPGFSLSWAGERTNQRIKLTRFARSLSATTLGPYSCQQSEVLFVRQAFLSSPSLFPVSSSRPGIRISFSFRG